MRARMCTCMRVFVYVCVRAKEGMKSDMFFSLFGSKTGKKLPVFLLTGYIECNVPSKNHIAPFDIMHGNELTKPLYLSCCCPQKSSSMVSFILCSYKETHNPFVIHVIIDLENDVGVLYIYDVMQVKK